MRDDWFFTEVSWHYSLRHACKRTPVAIWQYCVIWHAYVCAMGLQWPHVGEYVGCKMCLAGPQQVFHNVVWGCHQTLQHVLQRY